MNESPVEKQIKEKANRQDAWQPQIFDLKNAADRDAVEKLFSERLILEVSDDFLEEQKEYFAVTHPTLVYKPGFEDAFREYIDQLEKSSPALQQGKWVYFPWMGTLSHILDEEEFYEVRTARNKNLITKKEQDIFYHAVVGIGGMSVGSSVALAIVLQGGAKHIKLADHDRLALSNMNRIRAGAENLGVLKVVMAARQIYAMNPYSHVEIFPDGITADNIENFFKDLDVMVDEIDNLAVKVLIREYAERNKVPVVMAADNGDNALVEIERHDLGKKVAYFHSRMGDALHESFAKLGKMETGRMIGQWVGPENIADRMKESLFEIGKTIVSWPQLGGAALLNGAIVAYCVRKILTGEPLVDDRGIISLDEVLVDGYNTPEAREKRAAATEHFKKMMGM